MAKPLRRTLLVLFIASIVIAAGLMLAQDQHTLAMRSAVAAEDPRHPASIAALVGSDLRRGNRYTVLTNGDEIFPAMLGAIDAATRRISFETYIYDTGEVANRFTDALERAARRGVRVSIVVDAVGGSMEDAHVARLRTAGCRLLNFNKPRWYALEEMNYRTHRKVLVVDGDVGFTGGAGIADHWLGHAETREHWRDTHVMMRGPIVRLLEAAFYENFVESAGQAKDAGPVTPELDDAPPEPDGEGASFLVTSSPTGGSNDLKRLYLLAIAAARRTIDIQTPYFVTDESTMWALQDAAQHGVKIRILLEGDITDAMPVKYASRHAYERLLGLGIEIYEYQPTMMHTKVMVVDGVFSMFGSANFDNRSLELNDELNVAVSNGELARRFLQDFDQDTRVSSRLELERWRQRGRLEKTRERFWSLFGEVF